MADVKINLEATHKEFLAAIQNTSKSVQDLLGQLQNMSAAHAKSGTAATAHATAVNQSTAAVKAHTQATGQAATSQNSLTTAIAKGVTSALLLFEAMKSTAQAVSGFFSSAISNIDDFKKQTIGTAAAITNIRDETQSAGLTWSQVFQQNLKATVGTFLELERLSARYFASSIDLQLAYNAFAQRGIIIRKSELEQLAQLTDLILLLTQGQQTTIQVQEEIRSLINGTLRPTAQLGQLLKSYGKDIKEVGAEIRATQSLRPLEGVLRGAAEATKVIQGTFQAVTNGLEVAIRQIGRIGGEQFFNQLVSVIERFTSFINTNREKITSFFGVLGNVVGNVLKNVEQFAEDIIKGNNAVSGAAGPFIRFAVIVEAVALSLLDVVKVLATLIRDIPLVIDALVSGLGEVAPASDKAFSPTAALLAGFKGLMSVLVPGFGTITEKSSGFHKALVILSEDLKSIGKSDAFSNMPNRVKELTQQVEELERKARGLFKAGAGESIVPTAIAFKAGDEEKAEVKRLENAAQAAKVQADRAIRTARGLAVSTQVDISLQAARRDFALLEQGFELSRGRVIDLRSEVGATAQFIQQNFEELVRGEHANFTSLYEDIVRVNQDITGSVFANLDLQYDLAVKGLQAFKQTAINASEEVAATEVAPLVEKAEEAREQAQSRFAALLETNVAFVAEAEEKLKEAVKSQNDLNILKAKGNVQEALGIKISGDLFAKERLAFELSKADALDKQAAQVQRRIDAKLEAQIAVETRKLEGDRLRILQQLNIETGKLFQKNVKIAETIANFRKATEAAGPRTPFQASLEPINEFQTAITAQFAEVEAQFTATMERLTKQANEAEAAVSVGNLSRLPEINDIKNQQDSLLGQKRIRDELLKTNQEAIDAAISLAKFNLSFGPLKAAVQSAADGMIRALTDSFEGKSTNFVQLFKGVADNLFKDALQPAIESLKKGVQTGFKKAMESLAPGISGGMADVLGPAFLAGFALIASFVLGQLLSGGGSSASAGNPTVGIQSSEQVRGLIGGQTQIPIGLVGESLQNALVPTNILLSRIATGVERINFTGLSSSEIESTISRVVSDTIQSQV